jgi:hypothetical protein
VNDLAGSSPAGVVARATLSVPVKIPGGGPAQRGWHGGRDVMRVTRSRAGTRRLVWRIALAAALARARLRPRAEVERTFPPD